MNKIIYKGQTYLLESEVSESNEVKNIIDKFNKYGFKVEVTESTDNPRLLAYYDISESGRATAIVAKTIVSGTPVTVELVYWSEGDFGNETAGGVEQTLKLGINNKSMNISADLSNMNTLLNLILAIKSFSVVDAMAERISPYIK